MDQEIEKNNNTIFEQIKKIDESNNEWWSARELGKILEYSEYRHFKPVIEKAKEACVNSGQEIENHFEDFLEMVKIGSGAERPMEDGVKLSRYACYLIVQNVDPNKEVVALGQTYFAVQTRLQEIQQMDEYNRLSTEEKLRRENIKGKQKANKTHYEIGKKVRKTIKEIGGTMPEDFALQAALKRLKRNNPDN